MGSKIWLSDLINNDIHVIFWCKNDDGTPKLLDTIIVRSNYNNIVYMYADYIN
jgi:hypothetical protein